MPEPTMRYWQHVVYPERMACTRPHWPISEAEMERDPLWREVTVSPLVSGDVIEEAVRLLRDEASRVDALLDAAWDDEVFDTSIMSSHVMDGVPQRIEAAPEVLVRFLAARGYLAGPRPLPVTGDQPIPTPTGPRTVTTTGGSE